VPDVVPVSDTRPGSGSSSSNGVAFQQPPRTPLKSAKLAVLRTALASGLARMVRDSAWRTGRLLVLAYHGVSTFDEHEWNPDLYMPPQGLRGRLELLAREGYSVLPLQDAVARLCANSLPPRSVALTFDDGMVDFHRVALPLLKEFNFPATVYVTSYYSAKEVPVFRLASQYFLWQGRDQIISGEGLVPQAGAKLDLRSEANRSATAAAIEGFLKESGGGVQRGMDTLQVIADRVGVDFADFVRIRRLQVMSADEIRSLPSDLVDVQLHTHRHRVPLDRELFQKELEDNRRYLQPLRGNLVMDGFCYPSGVTNDRFLPWLKELGIRVATTCRPGLSSRKSDPLLLPRLVDSWRMSQLEFEGWLTGVAQAFPQKPRPVAMDSID
jgi:peptidoglycan/xylan/chitin deacetylase (PgdA/CDA1 family)